MSLPFSRTLLNSRRWVGHRALASLAKNPSAESAAAIRRRAIKVSNAPPSISAIPDQGTPSETDAAFIRPVGCTRRVFLLKPHFTSDELEGLAYRLHTLTKNDSLSSILIATDDRDDSNAMASSLVGRDIPKVHDSLDDEAYFEIVDIGFEPAPGKTWHVSSGYDALNLYESGDYKSLDKMQEFLDKLSKLALAIRGDGQKTKIPVITIPHGAVHDGGFALCSGTYVLATRESCFRIVNPSKGLSLDPVGLSYLLPRLGTEFRQPAASFPGCGMLLALTGYEADAMDMVETGLATHYLESATVLGMLEQTLAELPPWNQQGLLKNPIRFYGEPEPTHDHNAAFRNVAVAEAIHSMTTFAANGNADLWTYSEDDHHLIGDDPSLEVESMPWHADRSSDLVNYAATFDAIFQSENTLPGILERFREISSKNSSDPDEQEGIDVAADIVTRIEQQSPLALSVVHRLLIMGAKDGETIESCMARECKVQAKLFGMKDFSNWAKNAKSGDEKDSSFGWAHKSIKDVSYDEVTELIES